MTHGFTGRSTGLLAGLFLEHLSILHPTALVLDTDGIIRYVEQIPLGQLRDFDRALRVTGTLLPTTSRGVMP